MRPLLYFTENIWVNGKIHIFSFGEKWVSDGRKFWVATLEKDEPIVFEMEEYKPDKWKIVNKAPDWVLPIEKKLIELLKARQVKN